MPRLIAYEVMNRGKWYLIILVQALFACSQGPGENGDGSPNEGDGVTDTRDDFSSGSSLPDATALDTALDASSMDVAEQDVAIAALSVDPPTTTLLVTDRAVRQRARLTANARLPDGRTIAVAAAWSVNRPDALTITADGEVETTNATGGDVVVTARYGGMSATATVRIDLQFSLLAPGAPMGIETLFPPGGAPSMDATRTPSWIYPANETVFPQNVHRVLFQWSRAGNDRFRLNFESERIRIALYTSGDHPTCAAAGTNAGCFEPSLEIWRLIAASHPRESVRVTIDGASASAPGRFYRSNPLSIGFSRGPVPGAIYYWSTTAQGVRRATVEDATPTNFLTPNETGGKCVACHTLSRRGNRLGADVGGHNLWVVEVTPAVPPPRLVTDFMGRNIPCAWNTFSFDETRVITASNGVMTLRNAATGAPINTVPLPRNRYGTQPDWAPDGTLVAYVDSDSNRDRGIDTAQIAVIESRPGDMWGARTILAGTGRRGDSAQYPSFSWDSQWIAFARSTGNGQNDLTTDLWLMTRDGRNARALTRANTIVNAGAITTATIQDNMPTWAPSGAENDYAWIAFSSTRDYGVVLSRASRLGQREQIWVTAIDLERARMGTTDPSAPAFRLPAQDLDEDTHRPFWAEDRIRLDPDGGLRDASVPDASPDAGTDARSDASTDVACIPANGDCTSGRCCAGLTCWDFGNGNFQCTSAPL